MIIIRRWELYKNKLKCKLKVFKHWHPDINKNVLSLFLICHLSLLCSFKGRGPAPFMHLDRAVNIADMPWLIKKWTEDPWPWYSTLTWAVHTGKTYFFLFGFFDLWTVSVDTTDAGGLMVAGSTLTTGTLISFPTEFAPLFRLIFKDKLVLKFFAGAPHNV